MVVLKETGKHLSPNESPDPVGSTAASNSLARSTLPEALARISLPVTPAVAISLLGKQLTNVEISEILNYKSIYWLGSQVDKVKGDLSLPNCGYDDERNDYKVVIGDHLDYRYEILDTLGKGAFGKVLKCYDHKESVHVAVKIIRNARRFHRQVQVEYQILQILKDRKAPYCVTLLEQFIFRNHACLTFELLGLNLYEYLKHNKYRGFPIRWIRQVTQQLVEILRELKVCRIIHCDLKPENILFADHNRGSIKLIDFGSACLESAQMYTYIQSRFYRSPEVILGLKYSFPIDMWSLGCVLAELYTGRPLFPGENETDQLLCIMSVMGPPPFHILANSTKKSVFFNENGEVKLVPNSHGVRRLPGTQPLAKVVPCNDPSLLDFVRSKSYAECLDWSADTRMTPEEALQHPFLVEPGSPEMY
jgi:serine/threonine protein kinase